MKSWFDATDSYRTHLAIERNLSPNTVRAYLADVRQLEKFLRPEVPASKRGKTADGPAASLELRLVTARDVRRWLATLHGASSASTQGRKLASIRSFFRFLVNEELVPRDPTEGLPAPKTPRRPPRPLPVDDCHVLLSEPKKKTSKSDSTKGGEFEALVALRDRAIIEFLYGTGIRVGELVALDVRDLELASGQVRVLGKGRKERVVPIPKKARDVLALWFEARSRPGVLAEPLFIKLKPEPAETPRRLTDRDVRRILTARARGSGDCGPRPSPSTSSQLCDPFARHGRRSAGNSGTPRPCVVVDHAKVHRSFDRTAAPGIRCRASAFGCRD